MARTKQPTAATHRRVGPFKQTIREHGLAYSTMRDAALRGELAIIRIGRSWYVDYAELDRFLDRHTDRSA
jgi:hypothetical protein